MMSWTTADNVKFDDILAAFTRVGDSQVIYIRVFFNIFLIAVSITIGGHHHNEQGIITVMTGWS